MRLGMAGKARQGGVLPGMVGHGMVWFGRRGCQKIKEGELKTMVYEWSGYSFNLPAQTVGEKLEEVEHKYGSVTTKNFLEESRAEDSSTHALFEWDDSIAAEKWRLDTARRVIGAVKIVVARPVEPEQTATVRAFVNKEVDDSKTPASYVSFSKAMNTNRENVYRDIVIANAKRELSEFANKYRIYKEFAEVIEAIDRLNDAE